ncbi:MAG: hypothetical protein F2563_05130 [Actinobacteria bacterium]|uniref:Unannotated protein n=1 Tax=freshwater metagenome TaxID=449393 RepID=A0A6J6F4P6_9ZZZZ|nr:hypothetical protein [Actinomycetota bacterium]
MKTRQRYTVTYINKDGLRTFINPNQGRFHFDKENDAKEHLANTLIHNTIEVLNSVYCDYRTLRVDPIECYDHGDAISVYIKPDIELKEFVD